MLLLFASILMISVSLFFLLYFQVLRFFFSWLDCRISEMQMLAGDLIQCKFALLISGPEILEIAK